MGFKDGFSSFESLPLSPSLSASFLLRRIGLESLNRSRGDDHAQGHGAGAAHSWRAYEVKVASFTDFTASQLLQTSLPRSLFLDFIWQRFKVNLISSSFFRPGYDETKTSTWKQGPRLCQAVEALRLRGRRSRFDEIIRTLAQRCERTARVPGSAVCSESIKSAC